MVDPRLPICSICKAANAVKAVQSTARNYLHGVCEPCAEEEYKLSLKRTGVTVETVSAAQRRKNSGLGGGMTFTLRKMSGKGIRMTARYLAVLKLGGSLDDTPEQFYNRFEDETRQARRECESAFTKCTDHFEERLRDEDGYMSSNAVQEVAAFVQKRLGEGMWIEGEVAADHLRNGAPEKQRRVADKAASRVSSSNDVAALVKQLKAESDPDTRRKLRRQLRRLGHRGGSR